MLENSKAVGYDESFDFSFPLLKEQDPTLAHYFPSKFLGTGHSAHVFYFQKLDNSQMNFVDSNLVVKVCFVTHYFSYFRECINL